MNKKLTLQTLLTFFLMLSTANSTFCQSNILKDGIIIGLLTSPALLNQNLIIPGLIAQAIAIQYTKPATKEVFAGKLVTSLATWIAISMLKPSKKSTPGNNRSCANGCSCCPIND